jgi:hypothetical protein
MTKKSEHLIAHEVLCEERYKNLDEKMNMVIQRLDRQGKVMDSLSKTAHMGVGGWKAIMAVGTILGAIWTAIKITSN